MNIKILIFLVKLIFAEIEQPERWKNIGTSYEYYSTFSFAGPELNRTDFIQYYNKVKVLNLDFPS